MSNIIIKNNIYNNLPVIDIPDWLSHKKWIKRNHYDFMLKYNFDTFTFENFGEMLYSYISKKLDVPCMECAFAIFDDDDPNNTFSEKETKEGIIAKNIIENNKEKLVCLHDILSELKWLSSEILTNETTKKEEMIKLMSSISDEQNYLLNKYKYINAYQGEIVNCDIILKIYKLYCLKNNLHLPTKETRINFYKQMIMDYFLFQSDRNASNFGLVINDKNARLAPMYDNGMCLVLYQTPHKRKGNVYKEIKAERKDISILPNLDIKNCQQHEYFGDYSIKDFDLEHDLLNFKKIYNLSKKHPEIKKFVNDLLSIDLKSVLETLNVIALHENSKQLPEDAITLSSEYFNYLKINYKRFEQMCANLEKETKTKFNNNIKKTFAPEKNQEYIF